ncbi:alpha/beta fold hydrolase [Flagellimonas pacifica]|uniref:Predicted alpha/beta hydrolase n=1 Tax=Flagellimonas pacifica TaxID=1247520 RepID=A0A285N1N2_9FLAO|nr:alpha/beta fold hydrolase [Allomuricauda parva]SNZ01651.1 Predicted alpha/beta hydrolase [Allomuricauda parva]
MTGKEIGVKCLDNFILSAIIYTPNEVNAKKKFLIINSATAVAQRLYRNYALFMAEKGFHVLTYDYRGIAASRPSKLRGFQASFTEWGEKDVSSVLHYVKLNYPDFSIGVLGHSIGGTLIGMTPYADHIATVINIGAQTAYYKDWKKDKLKLYFMWHLFFPAITRLVGYFPGKKLRLLEDIPKGVVEQWHARRKKPDMVKQYTGSGIDLYYSQFMGKLLTLAIADDPIGTKPALLRIHNLFQNADRTFETVHPKDIGANKIGHFGFFSRKFRDTLWEQTFQWFDEV